MQATSRNPNFVAIFFASFADKVSYKARDKEVIQAPAHPLAGAGRNEGNTRLPDPRCPKFSELLVRG